MAAIQFSARLFQSAAVAEALERLLQMLVVAVLAVVQLQSTVNPEVLGLLIRETTVVQVAKVLTFHKPSMLAVAVELEPLVQVPEVLGLLPQLQALR